MGRTTIEKINAILNKMNRVSIKIEFECTEEVLEHIGRILSSKNAHHQTDRQEPFELIQILPHYLRSAPFVVKETHGSDISNAGAISMSYGCTLTSSIIITKK